MDNPSDIYYTVTQTTSAEFKDRGSRFIAYLFPIADEKEFTDMLEKQKHAHHKANHHCYALRLKQNHLFRSNDDGEPSGTAGKPILNQLISHELLDTACIVVRYFGGTKLGTSGLINAYKSACQIAIQDAQITKAFITTELQLHFDYSIMGQLMEAVKSLGYEITEKRFDANPQITLNIRNSEYDTAQARILANLLNRSIEDIDEDTSYPGLRFD